MGIHYGYFPCTSVSKSINKSYEYLFTPMPKYEPDPYHDVFEKAKLIVSCLKHGQYHADISKIRYPALVLEKMMENSLGPHSYANIQYLLLRTHGVVNIRPAKYSRYTISTINGNTLIFLRKKIRQL